MIIGHSFTRVYIVFRQSVQQRQNSIPNVLSSHDGSESDDENSDEDNVRTVPFPMPELSITVESSSIHTEIKDMVGANFRFDNGYAASYLFW